jgi:hypothetical protein
MGFLKTPTRETVDAALARLGKPGASAYFFDHLNNPQWIRPLYERGFFRRPPGTERDPAEGTVSFPDWPELRYLLRMAPQAGDLVGEIVLAVPETDNSRVRETMIQVGLLLSRELSHRLGERAVPWLDDPIVRVHFGETFAKFIAYLAQLGEMQIALTMAARLFLVDGESGKAKRGQVLDAWHLDRYLKHCLPKLLERDASVTLEFLCDRLCAATKPPVQETGDDYSYIWRRTISKSNYTVGEVKDVFVDAVRDTSLFLARGANFRPERIYGILLKHDRPILKRIAMYIAARLANARDPIVMDLLLDRRLVDRYTARAEYSMLLQANYPGLSPGNRARIEQHLQTDLLESLPTTARKEFAPEKLERFAKQIQRDRLLAFGSVLPDSLQPLLAQLVQEEGQPHEVGATVTMGPIGPLSRDKLQTMSVAEIVAFVDQWVPPAGLVEANSVGLGQSLHEAAKSRFKEFAEQAARWIGREAIYIRWIILGLSDAIASKGRVDDWRPLLDLSHWVVVQSDQAVSDEGNPWRDLDTGWTGVRQSVARLVNNALLHEESGLSIDFRDRVWKLLEILLKDVDPETTADVDESRIDYDSLTKSINCVRGEATHALFRYVWWVHKSATEPDHAASFDRMPEVRAALEDTLRDPSPAIRSVLGDWLRTLLFYDYAWTESRIDEIFPESEAGRTMWLATWGTFAKYSPPYDPAFGLLHRKYVIAVERLYEASDKERKGMGELGLGHHLSSYYWRSIGGEETLALLLRYFDLCSSASAAEIVGSLGRGIRSPTEAASESTVAALMRLWGELGQHFQNWDEQKRRDVQRQFGEWFAADRLPAAWALAQFEECLREGVGIVHLEDVLLRLESLARSEPTAVARCLAQLLKDEQRLWYPMTWQREVERVLEALLSSTDEAARAEAESIVNRLVEGGSLFARDILSRIKASNG